MSVNLSIWDPNMIQCNMYEQVFKADVHWCLLSALSYEKYYNDGIEWLVLKHQWRLKRLSIIVVILLQHFPLRYCCNIFRCAMWADISWCLPFWNCFLQKICSEIDIIMSISTFSLIFIKARRYVMKRPKSQRTIHLFLDGVTTYHFWMLNHSAFLKPSTLHSKKTTQMLSNVISH